MNSQADVAIVDEDDDNPAYCRVQLVCVFLAPFVKHCGLEVFDSTGVNRYHVPAPDAGFAGELCQVKTARIKPLGFEFSYYKYQEWSDPSGKLCECIHAKVRALNAAKMPYAPIPRNELQGSECKNMRWCNSNYATSCLRAWGQN
jgi:hypothetical protein